MSIYTQERPSLNARIIKVLWRQQQELLKKSPDHVIPIINPEDPIDIQADIEGPEGTPYESGIFRVKLFIPSEFPQLAPKGIFVTKIFHPNVSEKGEICVNTLKRDWNPKQWSLYNLFEVIKCLLIVPFPQSSLNEEAGKMFMDNYDEYFKVAKMLTSIHAKKKVVENNNIEDNNDKNDKNKNLNLNKDNNGDDLDDINFNNNNNNDTVNKKEENCDVNTESEDVEMKINNFSEKKEKKIFEKKSEKKQENIDNEIDIITTDNNNKDKMNISFLNEFSSEDNFNNNKSFWNKNNTNNTSNIELNNNNNNRIFNFDNDNYLENINITRSKTIKLGQNSKYNFLRLNSQSITSQIFNNSINQFSRMNSISSINSSVSNISSCDIKKVSTFKEKPKLDSLPLIHMNSLKTTKKENNPYGFFRCKTLNISKNESKKSNKDEINKWLMRI